MVRLNAAAATAVAAFLGTGFVSASPFAKNQHAVRQAPTSTSEDILTTTTILPGETATPDPDNNDDANIISAPVSTRERIPGAFIVELKEDVAASPEFVAEVEAQLGVKASIRATLSGSIFHGLSLQLEGNLTAAADRLQAMAGVESVSPVHQYTTPKVEFKDPFANMTNTTLASLLSPSTSLARRQLPIALNYGDPYHLDTQVNEMHKAGFTGKGIKAAIIGRPVDETHPYLKVSFSRNFLEADDDLSLCTPSMNEHETACAGILAMQRTPMGYVGVAPDVTLGSYRTTGCKYGGNDDKLLRAMQAAVDDGVQILSYSMSIAQPFALNRALNKAMNAAVEKGVFFAGPMGNDGGKAVMASGSPASALLTFNSGASERRFGVVNGNRSTWTSAGASGEFGWRDSVAPGVTGWADVKLPLYINLAAKGGKEPGGCEAFPANTTDLSKYIVLMRRPGCSDEDLVAYAAKAGAKYVMVSTHGTGNEERIELIRAKAEGLIALAGVDQLVADNWTALAQAGKTVTIDMKPSEFPYVLAENWRNRDKVAGLSSWGPTADGFGAAAIITPGSNSFTVVPPGTGKLWTTASGTSFSTPYTAGVAALVAQASGAKDWKTLYSRLANTGKPILRDNDWKEDAGLEYASLAQQGGGLVQAYAAAFAPAIITSNSTRLDFLDTARRQQQSFTIKSTAKTAITYKLSNLVAGTVYALRENSTSPANSDDMRTKQYVRGADAKLSFSSDTVTLQPGASATIRVTATDPAGLVALRVPIWSGWVILTGSDGSEIKVPYLGFACDLDKVPRFENIVLRQLDPNALPGAEPRPIIDPTKAIKLPDEEIILHVTFGLPVRKVRAWIVDAATGKEVSRADIAGYEDRHHASLLSSWRGNQADGKGTITTGTYKLVVKTLTLFGDENDPAQWTMPVESNVFKVA